MHCKLKEAVVAAYNGMIMIDPKCAEAWLALQELKRLEFSIQAFDRALAFQNTA
jgi:hypothetical protein